MLAQIETRGTDEISDVFDEYNVELGQRQIVQRVVDHPRIQMAGVAGRNLYRGNTMCANTPRIVVGLEISFDDREAEVRLERFDRHLQQGRLARSR